MLRPHTPLFNVASDAPDAGGQGEAAPKATIGQQLRAALSSKTDLTAKLDAATDSLATITAERDTARADLATAQARITELEAQLGEVNAALTEHQTEVATLKAAETDLNKRASEQAKQIVRGVGVQASEMPVADGGVGTQATADQEIKRLQSELAKTTDPKQRGEIVMQIRQLRSPKA